MLMVGIYIIITAWQNNYGGFPYNKAMLCSKVWFKNSNDLTCLSVIRKHQSKLRIKVSQSQSYTKGVLTAQTHTKSGGTKP